MVDAVIYCRVSSDRQVREGDGLGSQETRCRAYAASNNLEVLNVYRESGISGGSANRPAFYDLLNFIKPLKTKVIVIIDDINRLARDVQIYRSLKIQIGKNGGELRCVNMNIEDSPEGKFVETIVAATAELEKEQNARRVNDRMRARLQKGYWVFPPPVGYRFQQTSMHGKILVPYEPEALYIKEAFEGFANGRFLNQVDVQNFFKSKNMINARGGRLVLKLEEVKRIFSRALYAGIVEYPKWGIKPVRGMHTPLISKQLFDQVNEKLLSKKKKYSVGLEEDFPLRGLLVCAHCGSSMTGSWSTSRSGIKYPYYRCTGNSNTCIASPKSIRKEKVESDFVDFLSNSKPRNEILALTSKIVSEVFNKKINDLDSEKEKIELEIRSLDKEIELILQKILQCNNPTVIKMLEDETEKLVKKQHVLQVRIEIDSEVQCTKELLLDKTIDFISNTDGYWINADYKGKQLVQNLMFLGQIEYASGGGFGTANFSLPYKVLSKIDGPNNSLVEPAGIE